MTIAVSRPIRTSGNDHVPRWPRKLQKGSGLARRRAESWQGRTNAVTERGPARLVLLGQVISTAS